MSLNFQDHAFDAALDGGSKPSDVSSVTAKKKHFLTPGAYHNFTTDKTIEWELEQAIEPLGKLLEDPPTS